MKDKNCIPSENVSKGRRPPPRARLLTDDELAEIDKYPFSGKTMRSKQNYYHLALAATAIPNEAKFAEIYKRRTILIELGRFKDPETILFFAEQLLKGWRGKWKTRKAISFLRGRRRKFNLTSHELAVSIERAIYQFRFRAAHQPISKAFVKDALNILEKWIGEDSSFPPQ